MGSCGKTEAAVVEEKGSEVCGQFKEGSGLGQGKERDPDSGAQR
jgi:hypothetical protein